jgi:hypothetical protein
LKKLKRLDNKYFKNPILLEDGSLYIGEWWNNMKNGKGIQIWQDGKVYEGKWWDNII